MNRKAFTLMELIVIMIIIGVLTGIMVPNYMRAREKTMDKQALVILPLIRAAERNYKIEHGAYYPDAGSIVTSVSDINGNLSLDLVDDNSWQYVLSSDDQTSFTATMDRNKGGYGRQWSITESTSTPVCSGNCP
jgi:type II secretory pathway pseudopilin PulG